MTVPRRVNLQLSHSTERHDSFGYITGTDASHRCHAHASTLDEHSARGRERACAEVRLFFSVRRVGRDGHPSSSLTPVWIPRASHTPRAPPRAPREPRAPHTPPPPRIHGRRPVARRDLRRPSPAHLLAAPGRSAAPLNRSLDRTARRRPAGASRAGWRSLAHHAMPRRRATAVAVVADLVTAIGTCLCFTNPPTYVYNSLPHHLEPYSHDATYMALDARPELRFTSEAEPEVLRICAHTRLPLTNLF